MAFTVNKKAFYVLEFAKTESNVTVQRRFRIMYHTEPPTDKTIREWYMNSSRVTACALRNKQAIQAHRPGWPVRCTRPLHSHNWLSFGKFQDIERFLIHCERHFSSRLPPSGGTWKCAKAPSTKKKLGEILYLLICSFLPCLSWLLRSRVRKSRRYLWITLYYQSRTSPNFSHPVIFLCQNFVLIDMQHLSYNDAEDIRLWSFVKETYWTLWIRKLTLVLFRELQCTSCLTVQSLRLSCKRQWVNVLGSYGEKRRQRRGDSCRHNRK